jgi:TIR domain
MVDVFISHSSQDTQLARQVVDLLRSSLNLHAKQIRCTSVDGYRLPAGANTDERLREEVLASRTFISILSSSSLSSVYVLFELGARWGAKKPLFPLLAPGMGSQSLRGPLTGLNALTCETAGQLHQLVSDVGETLGIHTEPPAVYQSDIEAILYSGHSEANQDAPSPVGQLPSGVGTANLEDDYSEAEHAIRRHCERQWPNDYQMRSYCTKQQREALDILKQGRPQDIPEEVFAGIRNKCALEWPNDYAMRRYCEQQQFDSYRELER